MKYILFGCFRTLYFMVMNMITVFVTLFIHRNKSVILMGAWHGKRFGGNTRYLFQYLSENKEMYHLKKVIWVTRKQQICDELRSMGYESYMIKSIKGIYYHFKAGVHVTNNANHNFSSMTMELCGDIMGELSIGANKIHLSHAVEVSQDEPWENDNMGTRYHLAILWKVFKKVSEIHILKHFMLVGGGWDKVITIRTSRQIADKEGGVSESVQYVVTGFPEFCKPLKYTKREKEILLLLKQKERKILYVPTYRTSEKTGYFHPLNNPVLRDYLRKNNYLWIDKMHPLASFYSGGGI